MGNKQTTKQHSYHQDTQEKIVYGYIRECEQLFSKNNPYFNIPTSLYNICFTFYNEYLQSNDKSKFKINDIMNLAKKLSVDNS